MDVRNKVGISGLMIAVNANLLSTVFASGVGNIQAGSVSLPPEVITVVSNILGAAQAVGVIVAICILLFIGFKYMTAGAGDKAKAKDMIVPFSIGALVVATAPFIGKWVFDTVAKVN